MFKNSFRDFGIFVKISSKKKSPLQAPILNCSEGYLLGINTWSSSLNFNFPPD